MEIDLPSGCNVFYGTYFDNYRNNNRYRYYFDNNGSYILNQTTTNVTNYNNYNCITKVPYHTADTIYFELISIAVVISAFILLYKVIIKRLLP